MISPQKVLFLGLCSREQVLQILNLGIRLPEQELLLK